MDQPRAGCRSCLFAGFIPMQLLVWQFARAWLTKYLITLLAIRRADISRLLTSSPAGQDWRSQGEVGGEFTGVSDQHYTLRSYTAVRCQARTKNKLFNPFLRHILYIITIIFYIILYMNILIDIMKPKHSLLLYSNEGC